MTLGSAPRLTAVRAWLDSVTLHQGFGWLQPPTTWQRATGWDRMPPELRATAEGVDALWPGTDAPRLRWLGHSGFLIESAGLRLLIDPHLGERCTFVRRRLHTPVAAERLANIDAVLLSHAHFDHLHLPTLEALPQPGRFIVPAGCEAHLRSLQRRGLRVEALVPGESVVLDGGKGRLAVHAEAARHNGGRWHPFRATAPALSYILRHAARHAARPASTLYLAGDTAYGPHFADIQERHAPRAAVLPIGAYAPRWPLRGHHMNPEEAVRAALELGVETVVPCHFGTFTLSFDHPAAALPRFARAAAEAGVTWHMPHPLWRTDDRRDLPGRESAS